MTVDEAETYLRDVAARIPDDFLNFVRALEDADLMGDGFAYFLEKPYKHSSEYMAWDHEDKPSDGDGEAWDAFLEAVL